MEESAREDILQVESIKDKAETLCQGAVLVYKAAASC